MTDGMAFERSIAWAAGRGCRDALGELFRRYDAFVHAVIRPYAPTRADADDWAQDTWCAAKRGFRAFRATASVRTWLYKVAVNQAKQGLRVWKRHELTRRSGLCPTPGKSEVPALVDTRLMAAIMTLPPGQRQVFVWRVLDDLPNAMIAARLGITLSTGRTQYRKARLKLQRALGETGR